MLGDHLSKWCNAGAPLAGKSACIHVAGIPGDLPGGRNCWCQTEQAPLAVIPAGNCKIPSGIPAGMNSVHSRRYTGRVFFMAAANYLAASEFSHASNFKGHAV